jgi:DNA-binding PadR family transcriptional regulator
MKAILTFGLALALLLIALSAAIGLAELWARVTGLHRKRELEILRQLEEYGESFGLDLVRRSGARLQRGRVYAMLHDLEERELVSSTESPGDAIVVPLIRSTGTQITVHRRRYRITEQGVQERRLAAPEP